MLKTAKNISAPFFFSPPNSLLSCISKNVILLLPKQKIEANACFGVYICNVSV